MKAGILVKHSPKIEVDSWLSDRGVTHDTIGLVRQRPGPKDTTIPDANQLFWIHWFGQPDWDLMLPEDLVIFSS